MVMLEMCGKQDVRKMKDITAEEMRNDPDIFKRKISDIEGQASVAILPVEDWGVGRRIIVAGISGAQAGRAYLRLIDITGKPQVATFDWQVAQQPRDDEYAIVIRPRDRLDIFVLGEDGNFVLVLVSTEPLPEPHSKPEIVSVKVYGVTEHHMPDTTGNHRTLCGLDGDDPNSFAGRQMVADTPPGAKINCQQCRAIFKVTRQFKESDFEGRL